MSAVATRPARLRIALADDSDLLRRALVEALRAAGYDVRGAADGAELLAIAAAWRPDLVITDLQMPNLTGLDVLRELRAMRASIPAILMSGTLTAAVRTAAAALGVAAMLEKPFTVEDLAATVLEVAKPKS